MTARFPTVFVSHGAPTLIGEEVPARDFLAGLGGAFGRPKEILVASAHWETAKPTFGTVEKPETIHDFYGFPDELYRLRYPAPGAPGLAGRAIEMLQSTGLAASRDDQRGLDHGAWVPLMLMYPGADIPATQISLQHPLGPAHHLAVGRALAGLRDEGVLVLGSGSATHNLSRLDWGANGAPAAWAKDFDDWLDERLAAGDADALVDYRARAPGAALAHPRDEHLLPLFVALGAAGEGARGKRLHASFTHGNLSMAAYRFD
ncbi:MAG: dioxygenase [Rhodospirillales bacterium]|nr:dioxygenase [Rhodospirillales bacterium]